MQTLALPEPAVSFAPSPTAPAPYMGGPELFALLGTRGSEGKIVSANVAGEAVLYDADERLFLNLPCLNEPKGIDPVCISHSPSPCPAPTRTASTPWRGAPVRPCMSIAPMRPGQHQLLLRGKAIGTYCFDTSRHLEEWRHVGEWTMPVRGEAHYVPEFDLWFGFSARGPNFHLCALDLSAMAQDQQQPVVQYVFEDLNTPTEEDWGLMTAELVSLGAGKFCVAKCFDADDGHHFAVLIGIEIVRGDDHGLRMLRHKCTCYYFVKDTIKWVF